MVVLPPTVSVKSAVAITAMALTIGACGGKDVSDAAVSTAVVTYGTGPSQFGELAIPDEPGKLPVVVLVHGGFWKATFDLDLMRPLAGDLNERGYATWNIEYRRVGEVGGGYPNTLLDVALAIDHLATLDERDRLDLDRVAVVGHSAGGHLALWAAARDTVPLGRPGANPTVIPKLAIGQAAVVDLAQAADARLGGGAVQALLDGELAAVPERYAAAQPDLAGTAARIVIHGDLDDIVPLEQSLGAGDSGADVVVIPGADHFDMIDPTHDAWAAVVSALETL